MQSTHGALTKMFLKPLRSAILGLSFTTAWVIESMRAGESITLISYDENQDKGYAQFAHVAPVLAAQMTAGYQGGDDGNQAHRAFCPGEYGSHLGNLSVLHHRYEMKIEALAQDE